MKGLLIKDLQLMKIQKNFFIIIICIGAIMSISFSPSFLIGYLTFISGLFVISTMSYDEFDNGYAFLFSLPISRKKYVLEKYVFACMITSIAWLFSTLIATIYLVYTSQGIDWQEEFYSSFLLLPIVCLLFSVMIPAQLKYGKEATRMVLIGITGIAALIGFVIIKILSFLHIDFLYILINMNIITSILLLCFIVIVWMLISYQISIRIIQKKEF